ncbi:MAG: hypothetical protein Q7S96_01475 [bacterium]|nr:hypothetical protein [bacterium]
MLEHPPIPERHHGIAKDNLPRDVRSYVKNLEQQIRDQFRSLGHHGPLTNIDEVETAVASLRTTATPRDLPSITHLTTLSHALSEAYRTGTIPEGTYTIPEGHLPYESWKNTLNPFLHDSLTTNKSEELKASFPGIETSPDPLEFLIQYQEEFFQTQYNDPSFTIDRNTLHLSRERIADITASIERGETDFPTVVAPPRRENLTEDEISDPTLGDRPRTLTRVLFDRLIREKNIKVWDRQNPTPDDFLDQLRNLTLQDLTRTDLNDTDGNPITFEKDHAIAYLTALYPTLPRPAIIDQETHETPPPALHFMKWEKNPPDNKIIPNTGETIANKSQIDAVIHRYPLAPLSAYLVLFAQHYEKTGEPLDDWMKPGGTWSWLFGVIDPSIASDRLCVNARWDADGLSLFRDHPGNAPEGSRLRFAC